MQSLIFTDNVSIVSGHNKLLVGVHVSIVPGDRIGLVGPNGSGKSTLMKVLARIIPPTSGKVLGSASSYYVPQMDLPLFSSETKLFDYLSASLDEWWEITNILESRFGTTIDVDRELRTLSGGELVKLHLAIAIALRPAVLFLDEPTNHLDLPSLEILSEFLLRYEGAVVVVSHDPFFLDRITNTIWEIDDKQVKKYGGSYSDYRTQKALILEGQMRQHDEAKKQLKKTKTAIQKEQKRAAASLKTGRRLKHDRSLSALEKGYFAEQASGSAGTKKKQLDADMELHANKVEATKAKKRGKAAIELGSDTESHGRTLLRIHNFSALLPDGRQLVAGAELDISYGDRISLAGVNGVGKTILIRMLLDTSHLPAVGDHYLADGLSKVYLSQKYEIVDPRLSLLENMRKANSHLSPELLRRQLGNFMFYTDEVVNKLAGVLSGGEVARLAFAMITAAPIDLLVLDEPTNNLDIETIDSIVNALDNFKGAVIVISHNVDFLSQLGIDRAYVINHQRLKELRTNPDNEQEYYAELMSELEA